MTRGTRISAEALFGALADRTRLRLLNLMNGQELCVCYFVGVLGTNQPKISRHLAYLRRARIVAARKDGKWMHYRIAVPSNESAAKILKQTLDWLSHDAEMRRDLVLLKKACCSPNTLVEIDGAPPPVPVEPLGAA
jgi:ArsR family transcriptional regulator, arsenate/arsenite/antimonite-responsive transcriptional repressor